MASFELVLWYIGFVLVDLSRLLLWFQDQTFYYENIEGGHGGAADNKQRATWRHPKDRSF